MPLRKAINRVVTAREPWPLFVYGPAGTGKTLAALCLCDAVGGGCIYTTAAELAASAIAASKGELFDPYTGQRITTERFWCEWREAKLVVLDELGTQRKGSDWHYDCVKRGIDGREGKPLFIISNVGPEAIEAAYDDRIASRCCAGNVFEVVGPDRRLSGREAVAANG
jgi:DNA replication protein DnaC